MVSLPSLITPCVLLPLREIRSASLPVVPALLSLPRRTCPSLEWADGGLFPNWSSGDPVAVAWYILCFRDSFYVGGGGRCNVSGAAELKRWSFTRPLFCVTDVELLILAPRCLTLQHAHTSLPFPDGDRSHVCRFRARLCTAEMSPPLSYSFLEQEETHQSSAINQVPASGSPLCMTHAGLSRFR